MPFHTEAWKSKSGQPACPVSFCRLSSPSFPASMEPSTKQPDKASVEPPPGSGRNNNVDGASVQRQQFTHFIPATFNTGILQNPQTPPFLIGVPPPRPSLSAADDTASVRLSVSAVPFETSSEEAHHRDGSDTGQSQETTHCPFPPAFHSSSTDRLILLSPFNVPISQPFSPLSVTPRPPPQPPPASSLPAPGRERQLCTTSWTHTACIAVCSPLLSSCR